HHPKIITAADVTYKHNALAIWRPGRTPHLARHVEPLDGETLLILLYICVGFAGDLLGIGDGLRQEQSLGRSKSAHEYDNNKRDESAHAESWRAVRRGQKEKFSRDTSPDRARRPPAIRW